VFNLLCHDFFAFTIFQLKDTREGKIQIDHQDNCPPVWYV